MGIVMVSSGQYRQLFHPPCELHRAACEPEPDRQYSLVRSALEVHCHVLFLFPVNSSSRTLVISSFGLASREIKGYSDQLHTKPGPMVDGEQHIKEGEDESWFSPKSIHPNNNNNNKKQQQQNQKVLTG